PASAAPRQSSDNVVLPVTRLIVILVAAGRILPATTNGSASSEKTCSPLSRKLLLFNGTPRTTIVCPCPESMLSNRPSLATDSVTPGGAVVASSGISTPASADRSNCQALSALPHQTAVPRGSLSPNSSCSRASVHL